MPRQTAHVADRCQVQFFLAMNRQWILASQYGWTGVALPELFHEYIGPQTGKVHLVVVVVVAVVVSKNVFDLMFLCNPTHAVIGCGRGGIVHDVPDHAVLAQGAEQVASPLDFARIEFDQITTGGMNVTTTRTSCRYPVQGIFLFQIRLHNGKASSLQFLHEWFGFGAGHQTQLLW